MAKGGGESQRHQACKGSKGWVFRQNKQTNKPQSSRAVLEDNPQHFLEVSSSSLSVSKGSSLISINYTYEQAEEILMGK